MVTTTTFPLIHTFCDLREAESPPEPSAATMPFAISPPGEWALREAGWPPTEIQRIKAIFHRHQEEIGLHCKNSISPFIWEDGYRSSVYFVFSQKEIIVLSRRPIGEGSYKEVYPVVDLVAGKVLAGFLFSNIFGPLKSPSDYEPHREVAILASHRGLKNLLSLERTLTYNTPDSESLVSTLVLTDFYNAGNLSKGISFGSIDSVRCSAALQMIRGLMNIHAQDAIHGDLKPDNIYWKIDLEGNLDLVIGDFGAYTHLSDTSRRKKHLTTIWYCSPDYLEALDAMDDYTSAKEEVRFLQDEKSKGKVVQSKVRARAEAQFTRCKLRYEAMQEMVNDQPLDVWSLGVVFYELFCGERPPWIKYADDPNSALSILKYLDQVTFKPLPGGEVPLVDVPPTEPPEMQRLIQWMLVQYDGERPTIHQVYKEFIAILRA